LQVINHLQDCANDFRRLDRVYVPLDAMAANGVQVEALGDPTASPGLRACLRSVAMRTDALLAEAVQLPLLVKDFRLAIETAAIVALAQKLTSRLLERDPLSQCVHLTKLAMLATTGRGIVSAIMSRLGRATARPAAHGDAR